MIYQVAIDGPAASGKSTTARGVAAALGIRYLDTGAMYRALTLHVLESGIKPENGPAIEELLPGFELTVEGDCLFLGGRDISAEIRENRISVSMGPVCALPAVREWMVREQRRLGSLESSVVDGRDIGTVVFPHARFKFFLTADLELRALRRQRELEARGENHQLDDLIRELAVRDESDRSRKVGPLLQAEDAIVVDTGPHTMESQVAVIVKAVRAGLKKDPAA